MYSEIKLREETVEEEIELQAVADKAARRNQILSTLRVCFLCISCGNILGYTSSAVPSMREHVDTFPELSPHDVSWIGGLGPLGALCGGVFTIFPLHYFGPRRTIFYFGVPFFLTSWTVMSLAQSLWCVWIGRFIGGIGTGIVISCSPLYVVDIASICRRGRLGVLPQGLMLLGILTAFILGTFLTWRHTAMSCGMISMIAVPLIWFSPDSPKWLISKGQNNQALASLKYLQGGSEPAWAEFNRITRDLELGRLQRDMTARFSPPVVKACVVALLIMTFQQLSGINGITFYAVSIFRAAGGIGGSAHLPPIILATVQCFSSMTSCLIIERVGRRNLLLVSAGTICFAAGVMGFYFYCEIGVTYPFLFWVPLATLILYALAFAIGFGPVSWIIVAEILPAHTRNIFNPLIIGYTWFCVFLVTKSFPLLVLEIHIYGIFWMYAVFCAAAFVFIWFIVPETKGRTSSQIQIWFGYKGCDSNQNFSPEEEKNDLNRL